MTTDDERKHYDQLMREKAQLIAHQKGGAQVNGPDAIERERRRSLAVLMGEVVRVTDDAVAAAKREAALRKALRDIIALGKIDKEDDAFRNADAALQVTGREK